MSRGWHSCEFRSCAWCQFQSCQSGYRLSLFRREPAAGVGSRMCLFERARRWRSNGGWQTFSRTWRHFGWQSQGVADCRPLLWCSRFCWPGAVSRLYKQRFRRHNGGASQSAGARCFRHSGISFRKNHHRSAQEENGFRRSGVYRCSCNEGRGDACRWKQLCGGT